MTERILGNDLKVSVIGFGCMGMTHAYGAPADKAEMTKLLHTAVEIDYTFFDTVECYIGENQGGEIEYNEDLVGNALHGVRDKVVVPIPGSRKENRIRENADSWLFRCLNALKCVNEAAVKTK